MQPSHYHCRRKKLPCWILQGPSTHDFSLLIFVYSLVIASAQMSLASRISSRSYMSRDTSMAIKLKFIHSLTSKNEMSQLTGNRLVESCITISLTRESMIWYWLHDFVWASFHLFFPISKVLNVDCKTEKCDRRICLTNNMRFMTVVCLIIMTLSEQQVLQIQK